MPLSSRPSLLRLATIALLMAGFVFVTGLLASAPAAAAPLEQAAASVIKLTWSGGKLALVEQTADANGQVAVVMAGNILTVELSGGTFDAGSTAAGGTLSYPAADRARLDLTSTSITSLTVDLGSGDNSALAFSGLNQPTKLIAADIRSRGTLTLHQLQVRDAITATVGRIERGSAGTNVVVPTLALSATYGVGAAGAPLGTAGNVAGTGWISAEVNVITGSIYISNTGSLQVGISNTNGLSGTNPLVGIQARAATGNYAIDLYSSLAVSLPMMLENIQAPGPITVTAGQGVESGCMSMGTQPACIKSTRASVSVTALSGDIRVGRLVSSGRMYGDFVGNGLTLLAPNGSIVVDGTSYVTSSGGPVVLKAGTAVRMIKNISAGATMFTSGITPVDIEAPIFEMSSGGSIASSSAPMTITTDSAIISSSLRAPNNVLWIRPLTPGRAIELGMAASAHAATQPANTLALNAAEVAFVDAANGTVRIGGPTAGAITVSSAITRTGTAAIWLDTPYTLTQLSGARISVRTLRLSALDATLNQNNTVTLFTDVRDGLVRLGRTNGPTVPSFVQVGDGLRGTFPISGAGSARMQLLADNQFTSTNTLAVYGDGRFELNGFNQTVRGLVNGVATTPEVPPETAEVDLTGGVLTVNTDNQNYAFMGLITGAGRLVKRGLYIQTLYNNNTFSELDIQQGWVYINGQTPTTITVTGGTLAGSGSAGSVTVLAGKFNPGQATSPLPLKLGNLSMSEGTTLTVDFFGTLHDQVQVTGAVTLSNATLALNTTGVLLLPAGTVFKVIDNQGSQPVNGTFAGLPEGTLVTVYGNQMPISYQGGDGNDVTVGVSNLTLARQAGNGQTAWVERAFDAPLVISATLASVPATSGEVTFSGPASGAGLSPISGTATISAGLAVFTPTANSLAGTYVVTASTAGAAPVLFTLTNRSLEIVTSTVPAAGVYGLGQPLTFTVQWNAPVTVTGVPALPLAVGAATRFAAYVSGSGTSTLTFSYIVQDGDADLDGVQVSPAIQLNGGSIVNAVGQSAALTANFPGTSGVWVATSVPAVTSVALPANGVYTVSQGLNFDLNWNTNVVVSGQPTLSLTVGSTVRALTYVSGTGTSTTRFGYTVQAGDLDTDGVALDGLIRLNGGSIQDAAGLGADLTVTGAPDASLVRVDARAPLPVSAGVPLTSVYSAGRALNFSVKFDEPASLSGAGTPTLAFTLGTTSRTAAYLSGSGTDTFQFRYTVQAGDNDSDGIALAGLSLGGVSLVDAAGNSTTTAALPPTDASGVRVDTLAPGVAQVTAAGGYFGVGQTIDVQAVFTEPIIVSGSPQVTLTVGGVTRTAAYVGGSGTYTLTFQYTVQPGDAAPFVLVSPLSLNGGALQDEAGNDVQLGYTGGASGAQVDTTAPTVTALAAQSGLFKPGATVNFTVTWSEVVTVTGAPKLTLNVGGAAGAADYLSGSGTSTHVFQYTVLSGDTDADGIGVSALSANGADLLDRVGLAATLTLPALSGAARVDTLAPSVLSVVGPSGVYTVGANLNFVVTWTEPVTYSVTPAVTMTIGGAARSASYLSGNGTQALTFRYTTQAGDNGAVSLPLALSGALNDAAGNAALLALPGGLSAASVDTRGPAPASVSVPASGVYGAGRTIDFDVTWDELASVVDLNGNRALGKDAASPKSTCTSGETPAQAVDGDVFSKWCSSNMPVSMTITLSQTTVITQVRILHAEVNPFEITKDNTRDFSLETSVDGTTWQTYAVVSGNTLSITTHSNPNAAPTRYLRLSITHGGGGGGTARIPEIQVFGGPALQLNVGGASRAAAYLSGSGTDTYRFRYTISSTDNAASGISVTGFLTSGARLADSLSNLTTTATLPAIDTSGLQVDSQAPGLGSVSAATPAGWYGPGQALEFQAAFTEPVIVAGTPQLSLTVGTASRRADYVSGSGGYTLTFRYTLQSGDDDSDGLATVSPLYLNGGTLRDAAGNDAARTFTGTVTGLKTDSTSPTMTALSAQSGLFKLGDTVNFTVTWSEAVTVTGVPKLVLDVGGVVSRAATYLSGSGTTQHVFQYTVLNGDLDANGVAVTALSADGAELRDRAGLAATLTLRTLSGTARVDGVPPSAQTVAGPSGALTAGLAMRFVVTWTEAVTVTGAPYLTVTIGSNNRQAAYLAPSGGGSTAVTFSYTVQAGDNGAVNLNNAINLNGGAIKDAAGNAGLATMAGTFSGNFGVVDTTPPVVASLAPPDNGFYGLGRVLTFTLNWSEPVTLTSAPRLPLTIGGIQRYARTTGGGSLTASVFTYTVQAGDTAPAGISISTTLDLNGGTIADGFGNAARTALPAVTTTGVVVDTTPPGLTAVSAATSAGVYGTGYPLEYQAVFTEPVIVTGTPQLTLTVGALARAASYVSGSGTYTLTFRYIVQSGDGDLDGLATVPPLALNGGSLADRAGNAAPLSFSAGTSGLLVDTIAPTMTALAAQSGLFKLGDTVNYTVTWSEAVTVTGAPALTLTVGSAQRAAAYLSGSGTTQHVFRTTVQDGDQGEAGVTVSALGLQGGDLRDRASVLADLTLPAQSGSARMDGVAPSVLTTTGPSGAAAANTALTFVLTWTEPVTVTGAPVLTLTVGGAERAAAYLSGSGTSALSFRYTTQTGDSGAVQLNGDLALKGGAIRDAAGNPGRMTLTGTFSGTFGSVDTTPPTVVNLDPADNGFYGAGQVLTFTARWSEPVTLTAAPRLPLTIGGSQRYALTAGGAGLTAVVFTYTVQAGENAVGGIAISTTLDLNGGTIVDAVGNAASAGLPAVTTTGVVVDTEAPTLAAVLAPSAGVYGADAHLVWTTRWNEPLQISGAPSATLTVGAAPALAGLLGSATPYTWTFGYVVRAGDNDADGVALTGFDLSAGALRDRAGNAAVASVSAYTSSVLVDTITPTLTAVQVGPGGYGLGLDVPFTLTWSEPVYVAGPDSMQLTLTVGAAARTAEFAPATSGTAAHRYAYRVQAGDNDTDGIALAGLLTGDNQLRDAAGNPASLALPALTGVALVDTTPPAVTGVQLAPATYVIYQPMVVTVTWSEPVTVTGSPQIGLNIGGVVRPAVFQAGSGTQTLTFAYAAQAGDNDTDGVQVGALTPAGGSLADGYGNAADLTLNSVADTSGVLVDTDAPMVTRVVPPPAGLYRAPEALDFLVEWSEPVLLSGSARPYLNLSIGGETRSAAYLSGSGTLTYTFRYTVTAADDEAYGLAVNALVTNTAQLLDSVGNAADPALNNVDSSVGRRIDNTAPTVQAVTGPAAAYYRAGQPLTFTVTWSEPVTRTSGGLPRLALTVGQALPTARYAVYAGGDGTVHYTFVYTTDVPDLDLDGIQVTALQTVTAVLQDEAGNIANPALSTPPAVGAVLADTQAPQSVAASVAAGRYGPAAALDFNVAWDEKVYVSGAPVLTVTLGAVERPAVYLSGSGGLTLTFRYVVQAGDPSAEVVTATQPIALNGGQMTDAAGNDAALTPLTVSGLSGVVVDTQGPRVLTVTASPNRLYALGATLVFTVTFDEAVTDLSSQLPFTAGLQLLNAQVLTGTGTSQVVYSYTVQPGDIAPDGVVLGPALAGDAQDAQGNSFDPQLHSVANTSGLVVDGVQPLVLLATVDEGRYAVGQVVTITLYWTQAVTVTGDVRLPFSGGGKSFDARYAGGSGTTQLVFTYTVQPGDYISQSLSLDPAFNLNGGGLAGGVNSALLDLVSLPDPSNVFLGDAAVDGLSAEALTPVTLGQTTTLTAAVTAGDNVSYTWDLGDGASASGSPVNHVYPDAGFYTATVTAFNDTNSLTATATLQVLDRAIQGLSASSDSPTQVGGITHFTAAITAGTNVSYAWNFGDGVASGTGLTASHTYAAVGTYTAIVTATNGQGSASASTAVVVADQVYVLTTAKDGSGSGTLDQTPAGTGFLPGAIVTLTAAADPGSNFAGWSGACSGPDASCVVTMTVDQAVTATFNLNQAPVAGLSVSNSSPTALGAPTYFTAAITAGTPVTYTWDFGDGSGLFDGSLSAPVEAGQTVSHTYAAVGAYTATITATTPLNHQVVQARVIIADAAGLPDPSGNLTLTFTADGGSLPITGTLAAPPGALAPGVVLVLVADPSPSGPPPAGLAFAGAAFDLSAYQGQQLLPGYIFSTPVTLTVTFDPAQLGSVVSSTLELRYWNGSAWDSGGLTLLERDLVNFRLVYSLAHLSEFALIGEADNTVYLPSIHNNWLAAPDLVISQLSAAANGVQVVIQNQGDVPAADDFWVDAYINPSAAPTSVNQTWSALGSAGLVWSVPASQQAIQPGEVLTLTVADAYYRADLSAANWPLTPSTRIYVQVDSANTNDPAVGGVRERHEILGGPYNNIAGPVSPSAVSRVRRGPRGR